MIFKDYYKILELETSRVSVEEIKSAYRLAAKKNHPDVNVGDRLAEERIKDINEAYRVLSNSTSKRKYDRMWNSNVGRRKKNFEESKRSSNSIFSDFFNMFFGIAEEPFNSENEKIIPLRGEDVETEISISIEDAYYGLDKKISLRAVDGKNRTFTVTVPAGIQNGEKIRLIGQGKSGKNGGKNGDMFIKINIQNNETFKIIGYDLCTDLRLTPWEAALGTRVEVSSIDEKTKVYVPAGIQSGEKIKIPGKGYKNGKDSKGDLIVEIKIMVPRQLTKEEKELFEELNRISKFEPRKI